MDGLLVLDKPAGWTSFDVVAKLRGISRIRSIGHTGTLDPMATGVLVLCFGRATRLVEYGSRHTKTYAATIRFGSATSTDDRTGETVHTASVDGLSLGSIELALPRFIGPIEQIPPKVSAIKVAGRRAYDLARSGADVELTARPVEVYSIRMVRWNTPDLDVVVDCGPGTYIRSLARDLGEAVDSAAHLAELRRTRVGGFSIGDAHTLDEFLGPDGRGRLEKALLPMSSVLEDWEHVVLDEHLRLRILQGKKIPAKPEGEAAKPVSAGVDERGALVAILERQDGYWQPRKVFG